MEVFLFVLFNNISPIFLIIVLGYMLATKFELDINSLSKVNFYIFIPSLIFVKIYETKIDTRLLKVLLFATLFLVALALISIIIAKLRGHSIARESAFKNAIMFYNSGNFSLPLISLVFGGTAFAAYAISVQIMVLLVQTLITNTLGFYNAGRGQMDYKENLKTIFSMPTVYAIALALIFKAVPYNPTESFLWPAILYMKDGMIPIALLMLGIQLTATKFNFKDLDVYIASFTRLLIGPILAYLLILLLEIDSNTAQVLFISSSVPTAVSTALIAVEFNNEPDFASQVVLTTTLLSTISLTGIIYLAQYIF